MPVFMPAGRYIVCDGTHVARGPEAVERHQPFKLKADEYILSGGLKATDPILVDDDLVVFVGGKKVFEDDDHCRSDEPLTSERL